MNGKFVSYLRVSSQHQGMDGLGMEGQRRAIEHYLNGGHWTLLAEFKEVETGKRKDRPELEKAIALCVKEKATLLIAKLDRLARNAAFLLGLMESGVKFKAIDMPDADHFTIGILAMVAEKEARDISARTKAGLESARLRGTKLGNPRPAGAVKAAVAARQKQAKAFAENLRPVIEELRLAHVNTLRGLAECLNRRGYKTSNGKTFAAQSVKNLLATIEAGAATQRN
jgi:DNA invertase Pin-like site-specific DNA recombinase